MQITCSNARWPGATTMSWPSPPPQRPGARASGTAVARIGVVEGAPGLRLIDAQGRPVAQRYASFDHFA